MTPAIAPATALGRERVETLRTSALWRSTAWAELAPTARAMGADWDVFIRFSSGVVETDEMSGWMVSGSCDVRPIVETPHSCDGTASRRLRLRYAQRAVPRRKTSIVRIR